MDKAKALVAEIFTSKKALAALSCLVVIFLRALGLPINEEVINQILFVIGTYIIGQGVADNGKAAAKLRSQEVEGPRR